MCPKTQSKLNKKMYIVTKNVSFTKFESKNCLMLYCWPTGSGGQTVALDWCWTLMPPDIDEMKNVMRNSGATATVVTLVQQPPPGSNCHVSVQTMLNMLILQQSMTIQFVNYCQSRGLVFVNLLSDPLRVSFQSRDMEVYTLPGFKKTFLESERNRENSSKGEIVDRFGCLFQLLIAMLPWMVSIQTYCDRSCTWKWEEHFMRLFIISSDYIWSKLLIDKVIWCISTCKLCNLIHLPLLIHSIYGNLCVQIKKRWHLLDS